MATKKISDLQLISAMADDVNIPGENTSQTYRVTGAQVKAYIQAQIADLMKQKSDLYNMGLACSVSGNALTIALKQLDGSTDPTSAAPVKIGFRGTTAANGDASLISATAAASLVVSSGSTLGTASGVTSWLYVYALNNGGTIELAVSSKLFDEGTLQTTTAEGGAGAADSPTVLYSTTARTAKAIRLLGRVAISEATAGTWASAPTEVSLVPFQSEKLYSSNFFGEAEALGSLGAGTTARTVLDNPKAQLTLSAARTWTLPTTGVPAGYTTEITNYGDFALTIQSSGGNTVCTLHVGKVVLKANTATPTTAAHWTVEQIRSKTTYSTTFSFNGSGGTSAAVTCVLERVGNFVNFNVNGPTATSGTSSTQFNSNTAMPTAFMPTIQQYIGYSAARNNGGSDGSAGGFYVRTDGIFRLLRTTGSTAWTNSSSCGFQEDATGTYYAPLP